MKKVVLGIVVFVLFAIPAKAEVLILQDNYYIANVRIIGTDAGKTIYRWAEKLFEIDSALVIEVSKELPVAGNIIDPNKLPEIYTYQAADAKATYITAVVEKKEVVVEVLKPQRLQMKKQFWGYGYYYDKNPISQQSALEMLKQVPEAYNLHSKAEAGYAWGNVMGGVGVLMISWPIGEWISGQKYPAWGVAAIGGALVLPAITGAKHAHFTFHRAAKVYNDKVDIKLDTPTPESSWELKVLPWNVQVTYRF